jgi:hypothetical protein
VPAGRFNPPFSSIPRKREAFRAQWRSQKCPRTPHAPSSPPRAAPPGRAAAPSPITGRTPAVSRARGRIGSVARGRARRSPDPRATISARHPPPRDAARLPRWVP